MRAKDFLNFIIACAALGFVLLYFWPPAKNPPPDKKKDKRPLTAEEKQTIGVELSRLSQPLGGLNLLELADNAPKPKEKKPEVRETLTEAQKTRRAIAAVSGIAPIAQQYLSSVPTPPKSEIVELGELNDKSPYHLHVRLDTKSGSVRRVILNRFQRGTPEGKPYKEGQNIPAEERMMELIPQKLYDLPTRPSYVLYHYDSADDPTPRALLGETVWEKFKVEKDKANPSVIQGVTFATTVKGVRIEKTYRLVPNAYHVELSIKLKRVDENEDKFRYQLTGGHGLPIEGRWYTDTFRNALIGYTEDGSFNRSIQQSRELRRESTAIMRGEKKQTVYAAVAVQYFASAVVVDNDQKNKDFIEQTKPTLEARIIRIKLDRDLILRPNVRQTYVDEDENNKSRPKVTFHFQPSPVAIKYPKDSNLGLLCNYDYSGDLQVLKVMPADVAHTNWYDDVNVRVKSMAVELKKDQEVTHKYLLYNGPVKVGLLKTVGGIDNKLVNDRYEDTLHLNTMTDWHSDTFIGRFASAIWWSDLVIMFTNLLHAVFAFIYSIIGNNGICIILLTVMVRMLMFPVSRKQALTGIKMQKLGPEMKRLKEKYKDDKQMLTQEMMKLYREHGVNPLGSCWMLLLQMPIFMGLYWALRESIQFRLAPFLWIDNLAAPDMLFEWGRSIPVISRDASYGGLLYLGPYFNILPLLAITVMILQQKVMMPPAQDDQQAAQQKMMRYVMIVFAIFFYKVAAGLCIYFVVSSLWGFAERRLLPKKEDVLAKKPIEKPAPKKETFTSKPDRSNKATPGKKGKGQQAKGGKKQGKGTNGSRNVTTQPISTPPQEVEPGLWGRVKRWWNEVLENAKKK